MTEIGNGEWSVAHDTGYDIGFAAGVASSRKEMDRLQADYDAALRANNLRWEKAMDAERAAWRVEIEHWKSRSDTIEDADLDPATAAYLAVTEP